VTGARIITAAGKIPDKLLQTPIPTKPHGCVARWLNSLLFALLAPCHAYASTPENVNLFLSEP